MKVTRHMVERGAKALYKCSGWDRAWKEITPEGRSRFRKAALNTIIAAIPTAIRVRTAARTK